MCQPSYKTLLGVLSIIFLERLDQEGSIIITRDHNVFGSHGLGPQLVDQRH